MGPGGPRRPRPMSPAGPDGPRGPLPEGARKIDWLLRECPLKLLRRCMSTLLVIESCASLWPRSRVQWAPPGCGGCSLRRNLRQETLLFARGELQVRKSRRRATATAAATVRRVVHEYTQTDCYLLLTSEQTSTVTTVAIGLLDCWTVPSMIRL